MGKLLTLGGNKEDLLRELVFNANDGGPVTIGQLTGLLLEAQDTLGPNAAIYGAKVEGFRLKLVVEAEE